jgi:hypothetical protein
MARPDRPRSRAGPDEPGEGRADRRAKRIVNLELELKTTRGAMELVREVAASRGGSRPSQW